jgi:hypothetical protein
MTYSDEQDRQEPPVAGDETATLPIRESVDGLVGEDPPG